MSIRAHQAHEADGLEGVAAAKRVEDGRETVAFGSGERLVYLVNDIERDKVREVGAHETAELGELLEMMHDSRGNEPALLCRLSQRLRISHRLQRLR